MIALAGNKVDLTLPREFEDEPTEGFESVSPRQVPLEEAKLYADELGLLFFETSAKSGDNVAEMFTDIGRCCTAGLHAASICNLF